MEHHYVDHQEDGPTTPHDHHVLGGQRAMNEAADRLDDSPRWTWSHAAVLGAVAFLLGVIVWNVWKAHQ